MESLHWRFMKLALLTAVSLAGPAFAGSCDGLASLSLPDTRITLAQLVPAGDFSTPNGRPSQALKNLPEFCRVAATLTPTRDSDIKIEVWLPAAGWNRKFQAVGNGG